MVTRRVALAASAGLLSAGLAGCTDVLFGEGLDIEATAPSVSESALEETGYEEHQVREMPIEREFEVAGETRRVRATNWQAEYDKAVDLSGIGLGDALGRQRAATFSAVTTPKAEIAGQTLNPIDDMDTSEIVARAQQRYDDFGNLRQVDETTTSILGETTTVDEFEGEASLTDADVTVDLTLHVSEAVESGDDFALVVAGYPTVLDASERDDAFRMIDGVEHDG